MKKRLIIIGIIVIMGIIGIELYFRLTKKPDYYLMSYTIHYEEKDTYPEKILLSSDYLDYYVNHYDPNSYVEFANGDKFSIIEALNHNYLFLNDLLKKIPITKKTNFNLIIHNNSKKELVRKYFRTNLNVYYYEINDIQVQTKQTEENLLELISANKIDLETIKLYLDQNSEFQKKSEEEAILYESSNYKIYLKNQNIYLGTNNLNLKIIKNDEEMR